MRPRSQSFSALSLASAQTPRRTGERKAVRRRSDALDRRFRVDETLGAVHVRARFTDYDASIIYDAKGTSKWLVGLRRHQSDEHRHRHGLPRQITRGAPTFSTWRVPDDRVHGEPLGDVVSRKDFGTAGTNAFNPTTIRRRTCCPTASRSCWSWTRCGRAISKLETRHRHSARRRGHDRPCSRCARRRCGTDTYRQLAAAQSPAFRFTAGQLDLARTPAGRARSTEGRGANPGIQMPSASRHARCSRVARRSAGDGERHDGAIDAYRRRWRNSPATASAREMIRYLERPRSCDAF